MVNAITLNGAAIAGDLATDQVEPGTAATEEE
jgi:hypothetical protein